MLGTWGLSTLGTKASRKPPESAQNHCGENRGGEMKSPCRAAGKSSKSCVDVQSPQRLSLHSAWEELDNTYQLAFLNLHVTDTSQGNSGREGLACTLQGLHKDASSLSARWKESISRPFPWGQSSISPLVSSVSTDRNSSPCLRTKTLPTTLQHLHGSAQMTPSV